MKRVITIAFCLFCFVLNSSAQDIKHIPKEDATNESGDFIIEDNVLIEYVGAGGDVVIPEGVIGIQYGAFDNVKYELNSLTLPQSMTDEYSVIYFFTGLYTFKYIYVHEDNPVFSSMDGVLYNKDKTHLIKSPADQQLESFSVPEGVRHIGWTAFYGNGSLRQITFPSSLEEIDSNAFRYTSLESVYIPPSVIYIALDAFDSTFALRSFSVDPDNPAFLSEDGILYNKDKTLLISFPADKDDITEFEVPNTVTVVGYTGFNGCRHLRKLSIHSSVTSFYIDMGGNSDPLFLINGLYVYWKTPLEITSWVMLNFTKTDVPLYVPKGTKALYKDAPYWSDFPTIIEMEDSPNNDAAITFTWKGSTEPKKLMITATYNKSYTVDWGNGMEATTYLGSGGYQSITQPFSYDDTNDYNVTISVEEGGFITYFDCSDTQVISLDVSKSIKLERLFCYDNLLTSLDISQNTKLEAMSCSDNPLMTLDVSKNIALEYLACCTNQLTTLDVSKNLLLAYFYCYGNQLSTLDISKNTELINLRCYDNRLPLSELYPISQQISDIENKWLGAQKLLPQAIELNESFNLTGEMVIGGQNTDFAITKDNEVVIEGTDYRLDYNTEIITFLKEGNFEVTLTNNAITSHSSSPTEVMMSFIIGGTNIDALDTNSIAIYPNPTRGIINIDIENDPNPEVRLYSIQGELLLKETSNRIDISGFSQGMYILRVGDESVKVVKE